MVFVVMFAFGFYFFFFFFFNDTATTEIYTLSLHDALPIGGAAGLDRGDDRRQPARVAAARDGAAPSRRLDGTRSHDLLRTPVRRRRAAGVDRRLRGPLGDSRDGVADAAGRPARDGRANGGEHRARDSEPARLPHRRDRGPHQPAHR